MDDRRGLLLSENSRLGGRNGFKKTPQNRTKHQLLVIIFVIETLVTFPNCSHFCVCVCVFVFTFTSIPEFR
jgi:hypothetical protein